MSHQNRKQVTSDDGSIYEVEALCLSDVGTSNVLVISKEMQAIAIALLPSAHSMAKSREKRVFFTKSPSAASKHMESRPFCKQRKCLVKQIND